MLAKTATPELYGAIGDGITDDTKAIVAALQVNECVVLCKEYKVGCLIIPKGKRLVGRDSSILHYFAIDVSADCTLENIRFDGGGRTRGGSFSFFFFFSIYIKTSTSREGWSAFFPCHV